MNLKKLIMQQDLLFWAGLALLCLSVVLCFIHELVRRKKDIDIFLHLLKDRKYPVELIEKDILLRIPFEVDEFNYCWISTVFRKLSGTEENLSNHAKWMGRCGGFALFLSFASLPAGLALILAVIFGGVLVGIYRHVISMFFEIKTYKKAWFLYKAQKK